MRVFPAVVTALLAFVVSTLALRDYFSRDDLLSVARAYKRSGELVDSLLPRGKGQVFCVNKGQNKSFRNYPFVTEAARLHSTATMLQQQWNALHQARRTREAKAKEAEYRAALQRYQEADARLKRFERNGCV
ncbi:hypothetical protein EVJ58_g3928 [Rhodofomes roseus]|uniref:Uncharacterized protein n=1 Tax=Rhodofomes roseus TaxID=34475 RepID=A0A4Y9YMX6_9APHY|nr:hypothetical protein EVJ58_g3928 [Rhodofomes roseus]